MGRTAQFKDHDVFAWIGRSLAAAPSVTVQEISRGTGVSVGSLYHRFGSLEALLAETWLWARELAQPGLVEPLNGMRVAHALRCAVGQIRFAREYPDAAVILNCLPRTSLVRPGMPEALANRVADLDAAFETALRAFTERSEFTPEAVRLSVLAVPQGIIRLYLPDRAVPPEAEQMLRAAFRPLMALGRPDADPAADADADGQPVRGGLR